MTTKKGFSKEVLNLDYEAAIEELCLRIRRILTENLKRKGLVVAVSGGIDSSTVAALAVRALGPRRVLAILMPEKDSAPETADCGRIIVNHLGLDFVEENITPILEAYGCYRRRDEAIRKIIPEYGSGWKCKIVLPDRGDANTLRIFSIVAQAPDGTQIRRRLTPESYLGIVAATNFKQRTRKTLEYYHADRLNYAVAGTPNRLEYDQGFFVKGGDGLADIKPIAHLYKSQVYALARRLGLPEEICSRPPTTDTYSMPQSQEEFYFSLPYDKMDLCLYGKNHGFPPEEVAPVVDLTPRQVEWVYNDIEQKRRTTRYLHMQTCLLEPVPEIA